MSPRARSRIPRAWLTLIALATVLRLCLILAPRVDLYGPGTPAVPRTFIGEELFRGSVAQELIDGPLLPLIDYQYAHFFGGSLVTAILAVPAFLALGPTIVALKLVPLGFHLVALTFLFLTLDRFVSRRAAWFGGLFMALTPPGYTQISTVAWGSHMESNALAMLGLWLLLHLHATPKDRSIRRLAYGLLAGFAAWFGYQCLLFLAVYALFDFARDRRGLVSRAGALQGLGFVVGLTPWLVYNLKNDFAGLQVYGGSLVDHLSSGESGESFIARLGALVIDELPSAFLFPDLLAVPGALLSRVAALALALLAIAAAWHLRSVPRRFFSGFLGGSMKRELLHPGAVALTYLLVFGIGFAASDFELGDAPEDIRTWRYAMPAFPFLFIAAASGLDALLEARPRLRIPAGAFVAALSLACLLGSLVACDFSRFGQDARLRGGSREDLGRWLGLRYSDRLDVLDRIVERASLLRTSEQQEELYRGMGQALVNFSRSRQGLTEFQESRRADYSRARQHLAGRVPETYRRHFSEPAESDSSPPSEEAGPGLR